MKKRRIEILMGFLLLLGVFVLFQGDSVSVSHAFKKKPVVVIDPGHGGDDPGVIGVNKVREKDVNLEISKLLEKRMKKAGYEVVMTRQEDLGLYEEGSRNKKVQDMQNRCKLILETNPVFTISIHQNSYPDPLVKGPQVFYFTHSNNGKQLAKEIQDQLNEHLQVERKRVEKGNTTYYMLKRSESPTVIVECGFLSNPEEGKKLLERQYQDAVVQAILEGSRNFMDIQAKNQR